MGGRVALHPASYQTYAECEPFHCFAGFSPTEAVAALAVLHLRCKALSVPAVLLLFVQHGAFRGARDTRCAGHGAAKLLCSHGRERPPWHRHAWVALSGGCRPACAGLCRTCGAALVAVSGIVTGMRPPAGLRFWRVWRRMRSTCRWTCSSFWAWAWASCAPSRTGRAGAPVLLCLLVARWSTRIALSAGRALEHPYCSVCWSRAGAPVLLCLLVARWSTRIALSAGRALEHPYCSVCWSRAGAPVLLCLLVARWSTRIALSAGRALEHPYCSVCWSRAGAPVLLCLLVARWSTRIALSAGRALEHPYCSVCWSRAGAPVLLCLLVARGRARDPGAARAG